MQVYFFLTQTFFCYWMSRLCVQTNMHLMVMLMCEDMLLHAS